jgi:hypothetical protein
MIAMAIAPATRRVAIRLVQVYLAHIGLFLAVLALSDRSGLVMLKLDGQGLCGRAQSLSRFCER